jgi:hypothetical protein
MCPVMLVTSMMFSSFSSSRYRQRHGPRLAVLGVRQMGGTAIEVDVLPAQAQQFALAHRGLQRQLHHWQQPAIARLAAGGEQARLFAKLQAPVARTASWRQLDVAHRILDTDAPFLAGHFEDVTEQDKIPFDGRRCDLAQPFIAPAGEGMAHHQAQAVGFGLGTGLEGPGLQRVACWTGCPNAAEPRDGQERPGQLIDQSLAL